ncbi:MAG: helix-turn-helix transcriptional regulator [Oscillospiraceae bacterium]
MSVKDIIKQRRLKLGLTMRELAEKVGVSEATVSRWESGEISNMKQSGIVALAKVLDLSPSVIMGWDEDAQNPMPTYYLEQEELLLTNFRKLNNTGKRKVAEYVSDLLVNEEYTVLENEDIAKDAG